MSLTIDVSTVRMVANHRKWGLSVPYSGRRTVSHNLAIYLGFNKPSDHGQLRDGETQTRASHRISHDPKDYLAPGVSNCGVFTSVEQLPSLIFRVAFSSEVWYWKGSFELGFVQERSERIEVLEERGLRCLKVEFCDIRDIVFVDFLFTFAVDMLFIEIVRTKVQTDTKPWDVSAGNPTGDANVRGLNDASSRISGSAVLESEVPPDTMPSNRVITHMATTLIPYMALLHIGPARRCGCLTEGLQIVFLQLLANRPEFCTFFHKELQMVMHQC
ncbi:hypothetical protein LXL04_034835 [Taraxacum kok-saghyz]